MPVERAAGGTSLIDVLDRILDKGIVIDAWVRVSLVGIDLITVEARVVVAPASGQHKRAAASQRQCGHDGNGGGSGWIADGHPAFSGLSPGLLSQSFHLSLCSDLRRHLSMTHTSNP